ncbi:putative glycosyltransferase family 2 [Acidisarcina polymorpha]|uniref:Putative glycosyltransferase family 2 n=1 Tax=Acidisarcina polymorpha TaxID=2211140 RepID=A0A2Z5G7T1_9BACT|nr:glycosyltransferase family 2 protein [Acidisarcina polymorpha]AXC14867.1 putative glycosyltransferase family 2 [Acidisarcina polymorpha]
MNIPGENYVPADSPSLQLSVIVPARNEEDCLGDCLRSLAGQSDPIFSLGAHWEILVVNDGSVDGTRQIAQSIPGVTVIDAGPLPKGWTGKANAVWIGAKLARGEWLLFTDADTIHEPGDLLRAMHEAEKAKVAMLSYSPRQIVNGFWQKAVMPLVFCELALAYPPEKISNPESRLAAANGQFVLIQREAYFSVGGHASVAESVLEDVDLARLVKRRKLGLRFRYAPDALSSRMYRSFSQMYEGWTKNLTLLFANSLALGAWRLLDLALLVGLPLIFFGFYQPTMLWWVLMALWARTLWRFYRRVARSNFPFGDCAMTIFGLPLFAWLLWRSWFHHTITKRVIWKGRSYAS